MSPERLFPKPGGEPSIEKKPEIGIDFLKREAGALKPENKKGERRRGLLLRISEFVETSGRQEN